MSNPVLATFPIVAYWVCMWYARKQVAGEVLLTPGAVIRGWLVFPWRVFVGRVRIHQTHKVPKMPVIYRSAYAKEGQKEHICLSALAWRPSVYCEQCHSSFVSPTAASVAVTTQYAAVANGSPPCNIIVLRPASNRGRGGSLPSPEFGFYIGGGNGSLPSPVCSVFCSRGGAAL